MFTSVLFVIKQDWKQSTFLRTEEMVKLILMHTIKYSTPCLKNEVELYVLIWDTLQNVLSENGKLQNGVDSVFLFHFFKMGKCICKNLLVYEYLNKIKQIPF